jgi:muramoyltetrapeptide carboxypeptidase
VWLRQRYCLRVRADLFASDAYLAGGDARRAEELSDAMEDDDVKAIAVARGGYGAMRILEALPWAALERRPKWLIGFSDITALHAMAWRAGVASVHGPNVTGLGREASPRTRAAWLSSLEQPASAHAWRGLRVVHPGRATGPIVGGNLAIIQAMAAAQKLIVPEGCILALEDVTEAPYRIDRMLTSLRLGGHLARAAGLVLGGFDRCAPGPDGRAVDEVLAERTSGLGIPVLAGAPFGHGAHNDAFVLGSNVHLESDAVHFLSST